MKVLKFGGTSVGSIENINNVKQIVTDGDKKIVVLSAMSGTTNYLVTIAKAIQNSNASEAINLTQALHETYINTVKQLILKNTDLQQLALHYVNTIFNHITDLAKAPYSIDLENEILAQGELLSTYMVTQYFKQEGISTSLLPALSFMKINADKEPDMPYIKTQINQVLKTAESAEIYITQGFICLNDEGKIANLQRGGSDYTATIIGAAILAEEVQIWTDIDGMHNNDPRHVPNTRPIANLSFDEAAELAYFGAKILHPQTVSPVQADNIPVRLKNTMNPNAFGTLIDNNYSINGIKAIAAKDGITAIKIKSARMLNAHGFLKKIFEIFEIYKTSIDMITTSEVAVSLTIDDDKNLNKILVELEKIASIEVDTNKTIVCMVGHGAVNHPETYRLFKILQDVKIRMISYGGSNNNISLLINSDDKILALNKLNQYLFELEHV